jgi:hypothetical protein
MKRRLHFPYAVAIALCVATTSLVAHHGAAAYALEEPITLSATITKFDWRSPHALISFDAAGDDGAVEHWVAETAGLVILVRAGWDRHALEPGDQATIVGFRAANGTPTMLLRRLVLSDGTALNNFIPTK